MVPQHMSNTAQADIKLRQSGERGRKIEQACRALPNMWDWLSGPHPCGEKLGTAWASSRGCFLIALWMAHTPREVPAKNFDFPAETFAQLRKGDLCIVQGKVPGPVAADQRAVTGPQGGYQTRSPASHRSGYWRNRRQSAPRAASSGSDGSRRNFFDRSALR
jgi:hypothetical protein